MTETKGRTPPHFVSHLQGFAALDEDAVLGSHTGANHDCGGRGQAQGTGAGDAQDSDGGLEGESDGHFSLGDALVIPLGGETRDKSRKTPHYLKDNWGVHSSLSMTLYRRHSKKKKCSNYSFQVVVYCQKLSIIKFNYNTKQAILNGTNLKVLWRVQNHLHAGLSRRKMSLTGKYFSTRGKSKNPIIIQASRVRKETPTIKGTK